ncbi:MAG: nicotinate phosphoribosyltransferase, partial [Oscillospiraceae bacterium]|nr:nicotinate phosphoribosyltransferase [Oscillospiraceae bacterium]
IYENGKRVYTSPSLKEIQAFCKQEQDRLWDEIKRFENPHKYYVDLSEKLWTIKTVMLTEFEDINKKNKK